MPIFSIELGPNCTKMKDIPCIVPFLSADWISRAGPISCRLATWLAILVSSIVQIYFFSAAQAENADFFLNRGRRYMAEKKYSHALADFWLVSGKQRLPPDVTQAIHDASRILGIENYEGAIGNNPRPKDGNASAYYTWATWYFGAANQVRASRPRDAQIYFNNALRDCKEAVSRNPNSPYYYNTCGASARELGNFREAVKFYDEAIRLKPDLVNAWAGRGISYARMGDADRAMADCEKASQVDPKYTYILYCRGLVEEAKGFNLLAARELEAAIRMDPANTRFLEAWSRVTGAPVSHESRVALVIGNAVYKKAPLDSPVRDAEAVAAALEKLGFKVFKGTNVNRLVMNELFEEFNRLASDSDVALFYFSGHGGEYKGQNYLVPADVDLADDSDFRFEWRPHAFEGAGQYIDLQDYINQLQNLDKIRLVFVDACRSSEALAEWDRRGLVFDGFEDSTEGMFVAYATSPDKFSYDGGSGITTFTKALVDNLTRKGVEIRDLFKVVQATTEAAKLQKPQSIDRLKTKFYFYPQDVRFPLVDATP